MNGQTSRQPSELSWPMLTLALQSVAATSDNEVVDMQGPVTHQAQTGSDTLVEHGHLRDRHRHVALHSEQAQSHSRLPMKTRRRGSPQCQTGRRHRSVRHCATSMESSVTFVAPSFGGRATATETWRRCSPICTVQQNASLRKAASSTVPVASLASAGAVK